MIKKYYEYLIDLKINQIDIVGNWCDAIRLWYQMAVKFQGMSFELLQKSHSNVLLLYKYLFISVIHEWVKCVKTHVLENGSFQNEQTKTMVCKNTKRLLYTILEHTVQNKKTVNYSYKYITNKTVSMKLKEKKRITDMFKNLTTDERRLEYMQKSMQMGQWSIGLQKGVYKYDKKFDEKNTLLFEMVVGDGGEAAENMGGAMGGAMGNDENRQDDEGGYMQNEFNLEEGDVDYSDDI